MEQSLQERELERAQLLRELEEVKTGSHASQELQDRLKAKEEHIASLRKKHRQLVDLTAVSSRNTAKISKLQDDVKDMKRKKVDLQKQLTKERKDHASEVRELRKTANQKERELNKYKKISVDRENEARRANMMAKTRLVELGQMRSKYRDAEKKLRLQSVKRGVMAKAGLDPVMLGRRAVPKSEKDNKSKKELDTDKLRDYFDGKVAELVRKDALVDKLAKEWEEHFELTTLVEEMGSGSDKDASDEESNSLEVQIHFKEDRIRQLAARIGDTQKSSIMEFKGGSFINDEKFSAILAGRFHSVLLVDLSVNA